MDTRYLRYVSLAVLPIAQDKKKFIVGRRIDNDVFKPGALVFPSERLQQNEQIISQKLQHILETEVPGVIFELLSLEYIGNYSFYREDNVPVLQLCFAIRLEIYSDENLPAHSCAFKEILWADSSFLEQEYSRTRNKYIQEMIRFCRVAQEKGMLE